jgi:hypothetical protein
LLAASSVFIHPPTRSDDGANGHGPPLRHSIISPALAQPTTVLQDDRDALPNAADSASAAAVAAAAASADAASADDNDDFEPEQRPFSAAIRAHVSRTVTSADSDSGDDDRDGSTMAQMGSIMADAGSAAAFDSSSLILKRGWLRKLARFGRDMKRCDGATNRNGFQFVSHFVPCGP